ncbi:hypothetical protein P4O66_003375 [Electrophorus voltai]|uniref:Uncharacterized protein n=1 Tax=Electrophorus voltai TaxID=2609070 RepID=A0AAD9DLY6_9TELE|nr:hypothetical protein P4O66_003375 [Electrophorus voltai]
MSVASREVGRCSKTRGYSRRPPVPCTGHEHWAASPKAQEEDCQKGFTSRMGFPWAAGGWRQAGRNQGGRAPLRGLQGLPFQQALRLCTICLSAGASTRSCACEVKGTEKAERYVNKASQTPLQGRRQSSSFEMPSQTDSSEHLSGQPELEFM